MDALRLVFVNHCHPEMPHVCALRARGFAEAMARRGHQVVLLSETLDPGDDAIAADDLGRALSAHDWTSFYRLACPPRRAPLLRRARRGRLPWLCNKAVLAAAYATSGGPFADWVGGARPYGKALAEDFRPQAVWGIFGNTGAWLIARQIAKRSAAPWVMDLKDGWGHFVPAGMRGSTARRFADAAAATALSEAHARELRARFGVAAEVVYSGIPPEASEPPGQERHVSPSDIVVSGSLYESGSVDILVAGLRRWLADRPDGDRPRLRYFGTDGDRLRAAASGLGRMCEIDIQGYRPLDELYQALRASRVNLYVRSPTTLFHHKLIELLSCGRPIVTIRRESVEARRIAAELGGRLTGCDGAADLARALADAWSSDVFAPPDRDRMARYTWDSQAVLLERVLERAVG